MNEAGTIRVKGNAGDWVPIGYTVKEHTECGPGRYGAEIHIPSMRGLWVIVETGMIGNIGGNDWAIYELHPDDCARICNEGRDLA